MRKPESNRLTRSKHWDPRKVLLQLPEQLQIRLGILAEFEQYQLGIHNGHLFPSFATQSANGEGDLQNVLAESTFPT